MPSRDVTWVYCRCGHCATLPRQAGLRDQILARAVCSICGARGAIDLRHGYIAAASETTNKGAHDESATAFDFPAEDADFRALFLGFQSADELKEWGKQIERDRLAGLASDKGDS